MSAPSPPAPPTRRARRLWIAALGLVLVLAGAVSRVASPEPDGLERVAQDTGFAGSALERVGPLSYDGPSALIGVGLVLLAVWGLGRVLRGR